MSIQINDKEVDIIHLGTATEENGVVSRKVTFEADGEQFELDVLLTPNGTGSNYDDPNNFYAMNKDTVDASLQEYFSKKTS